MGLFFEVAPLAWDRGFNREDLKEKASIFKRCHSHLVFGAFGLIRERDIADALHKGRYVTVGNGAAIYRTFSRPSKWTDFRGDAIPLAPGDIIVDAIASLTPESATRLVRKLSVDLECRGWRFIEVFEEDHVAKGAVLDAGYAWQGTRTSAGASIKGLYLLGGKPAKLPREEQAVISVLAPEWLNKKEINAIKKELFAVPSLWAQHYSNYNKRKSWTSFALRGYDDSPAFIIKPSEMTMSWKRENPAYMKARPRWTPVSDQFVATIKCVRRLKCGYDRVRFMCLRAKDGELSRHSDITDREAGLTDGKITRLHVPIITSDAVTFYGWDAHGIKHTKRLPEGALSYLDQRKPHAATNKDPMLDRVHLVIDCVSNEEIRCLVRGGT